VSAMGNRGGRIQNVPIVNIGPDFAGAFDRHAYSDESRSLTEDLEAQVNAPGDEGWREWPLADGMQMVRWVRNSCETQPSLRDNPRARRGGT